MSSSQNTAALSKVLQTGPNLAYSLALHDTLKKLEKMKNEEPSEKYNIMVEAVLMSILSGPSAGDA